MISSISQNSLQTGASLSATRSSANAAPDDRTASRLATIPPETAVEDPTMGAATIVDFSPYMKATQSFQHGDAWVADNMDAGRSMATIKEELNKIDALVARQKPELAKSNWDFQLVDGKFKVTGVNQEDAKWLESELNSSSAFLDAAQNFIDVAVGNLETSDANPAREDLNAATGKLENYTFYNVADQLKDKLSFRDMLSRSDDIIDSNIISMPDADRGMTGLAVVANMLRASNLPVESDGPFYTIRYDARQG